MRTVIDEAAGEVIVEDSEGERRYPLASNDGFLAASAAWLRAGWDTKYVYGFTWFGRPMIQLPDDMIRLQEVVYQVKPDIIIETGVAHGGSLMFHASLCKAMGKGRVIGIDVDIRPHNRAAIEAHELFPLIELFEGSSINPAVVSAVRASVPEGGVALVILDSNHARDHVLAELRAYAPLVSPGSFILACDGIMARVAGGPRTNPDWGWNNPLSAISAFLAEAPEFEAAEPGFLFNEGMVRGRVTYWPQAYLRRRG